jgi:hypothetical protein
MGTVNYAAEGGVDADLSARELDEIFSRALAAAVADAGKGRALIIPPDVTRFHSMAGFFTDICVRELGRDRIIPSFIPNSFFFIKSPLAGSTPRAVFSRRQNICFTALCGVTPVSKAARLPADTLGGKNAAVSLPSAFKRTGGVFALQKLRPQNPAEPDFSYEITALKISENFPFFTVPVSQRTA